MIVDDLCLTFTGQTAGTVQVVINYVDDESASTQLTISALSAHVINHLMT